MEIAQEVDDAQANQPDKLMLEIRKLHEDIKSTKLNRLISIVSAVVSTINIAVICISAFFVYSLVQTPSVDIAKEDSDRILKIELIKMLIDVEKSKDIADKERIMDLINFYMMDIFTSGIREKIAGFVQKNAPFDTSKSKCRAIETIVVIKSLDKDIREAQTLIHEEVSGVSGSKIQGIGPKSAGVAVALESLKEQRANLIKGLSPECLAIFKQAPAQSLGDNSEPLR